MDKVTLSLYTISSWKLVTKAEAKPKKILKFHIEIVMETEHPTKETQQIVERVIREA